MTVKFDATKKEITNVDAIVARIVPKICAATGANADELSLSTRMDLLATHANGCPMDFDRMREADDFNILHDIAGIGNHLDRETGKIVGFFVPRFAKAIAK